MAQIQMTDVQTARLAVQPVDARGNPALIDGEPAWAVSDENLLGLSVEPGGLSAVITAKGPIGTAQVNVTADADLGAGVTQIAGALDVQVVASEAVGLNITAAVEG